MPILEEGTLSINPFIFSHSGKRLGPGYPAPTLEDMAVSLGRICRFVGHGLRWWSVLQHSFVVGDLLEKQYRSIGLLHDGAESILNDPPTPFKVGEVRQLERVLLDKIYFEHLNIVKMDPNIWEKVKVADTEAFVGEVHVVGTAALRELYPDRSKTAEKLVKKYLQKYPMAECVSSEGTAVIDFVRRVKSYQ